MLNQIIGSINSFIWGVPLLVLVLGVGGFYTLTSGFFQFSHLGHILKNTFGTLLGKSDAKDGGDAKGIMTSFQAVSSAIGGSVGVGNIGGVATAVATGGPGAVFWIWICALVGMLTKMVEVTLAVYYRKTDEKGDPYGGPTYYMERGLGEEMGFPKIGWLILAFTFGTGIFTSWFLTLQNYTVAEGVGATFGVPMIAVSILYTVCVYAMTIGGLKQLGTIAGYLVPFMCIFYVVAGIIILLMQAGNIPGTFGLIFKSAFTGHAAVGGFVGSVFSKTIRIGVARAVYSNEAGWGTSPMVHSTAQVDHPVKQGLWGSFEVFVDTIIVCTITGLVVINTGVWNSGTMGASLTLSAFHQTLGPFGSYTVAVSVFLFGLTTTGGWYVYYNVLLRHWFGNSSGKKDTILKLYNLTYPLPGLILTIYAVYVGMPGETLWEIADLATGIPTFVNLIVLAILFKKFLELMKDYKARYLGVGTVDPNFALFYEDKKKK